MLESVHSDDGAYCVDFFVAEDGSYGCAHFRADPEDQGGWTLQWQSSEPFMTAREAGRHAKSVIPWLTQDPAASRQLEDWLARSADR